MVDIINTVILILIRSHIESRRFQDVRCKMIDVDSHTQTHTHTFSKTLKLCLKSLEHGNFIVRNHFCADKKKDLKFKSTIFVSFIHRTYERGRNFFSYFFTKWSCEKQSIRNWYNNNHNEITFLEEFEIASSGWKIYNIQQHRNHRNRKFFIEFSFFFLSRTSSPPSSSFFFSHLFLFSYDQRCLSFNVRFYTIQSFILFMPFIIITIIITIMMMLVRSIITITIAINFIIHCSM